MNFYLKQQTNFLYVSLRIENVNKMYYQILNIPRNIISHIYSGELICLIITILVWEVQQQKLL